MKALTSVLVLLALSFSITKAARADGYKTCTKLEKASWKSASDAEAKAKAAGYEVYGVKDGKLFELFYSPEDLSVKHTIAK